MLELRDLHVKFKNRDREAVGGISLTIHDGEIVGLGGISGSGKTVTAMSIAGHAKRSELRKLHGKEIGVVFQQPMSAMDPLMCVGKQVEEVLLIHTKLSDTQRKEKALEAMASVDLHDVEHVYNSYPHELSGGMLQRVMIAAAIVSEPSLLLLDEPTTALDVTIQAQLLALLKKLNRERGMSMLLISHNLNVMRKLCSRVAIMERGVLVEVGDTEEIYERPQHPYTKHLIESIPTRNRRLSW